MGSLCRGRSRPYRRPSRLGDRVRDGVQGASKPASLRIKKRPRRMACERGRTHEGSPTGCPSWGMPGHGTCVCSRPARGWVLSPTLRRVHGSGMRADAGARKKPQAQGLRQDGDGGDVWRRLRRRPGACCGTWTEEIFTARLRALNRPRAADRDRDPGMAPLHDGRCSGQPDCRRTSSARLTRARMAETLFQNRSGSRSASGGRVSLRKSLRG